VREIFLLLLFAYASYIFSEMFGFSGVITLFCCGFTMSYYAFQNLSQKSKISSTLAIETIGHAAEAFVFTYLGLGIYGMQQDKFSSSFMLAVLFSCVLARAVGVFLPSLFVGICRYFDMRISMKQLLIIWFSGSIRGAIAFALSL
jgi:NhaP-type Na+/H+ or K+/H+ antiporter